MSTDKVERSGSIKRELRIAIFKLFDGVLGVTLVVILLVHLQHRVRTLLVLKYENVIDLKSVARRPLGVTLGGVQDPTISITSVEVTSMGEREEGESKEEKGER